MSISRAKNNLTNLLQNKFKVDMKYLMEGGFFLGLGQFLAAASGFILTVGLVNFLDKASYGLYSYIFGIIGTLSAFALLGIDTAVIQAVAKGHDSTVHEAFKLKLKWSMFATIVTTLLGFYYLFKDDQTLGFSLLIAGACSSFLQSTSLYTSFLNGKKQFKKISFDNSLRNVASVTCMLLAAFVSHNVILVILVYFLVNTLFSTIRYYSLASKIEYHKNLVDTSALIFGKHLSVIKVLNTIMNHIDKIIVFQLLGATSLAIYAISIAPVKQLQGFSKITSTLATPKFSLRTSEELNNTMSQKVFLSFCFYSVVVLSYFLLSPFIFNQLFPDYLEAIQYTQLLSLSLLFVPFLLFFNGLTALEMKKELYILSIIKPILKILPLVFLTPIYGIWGAVAAYLIFSVLYQFITMLVFKFGIKN